MAGHIIHMDEAVQLYGADNVINAVEFAADSVQHTRTSVGCPGASPPFQHRSQRSGMSSPPYPLSV